MAKTLEIHHALYITNDTDETESISMYEFFITQWLGDGGRDMAENFHRDKG
jgi:hypothetical protein